jgi:hypothetical protein
MIDLAIYTQVFLCENEIKASASEFECSKRRYSVSKDYCNYEWNVVYNILSVKSISNQTTTDEFKILKRLCVIEYYCNKEISNLKKNNLEGVRQDWIYRALSQITYVIWNRKIQCVSWICFSYFVNLIHVGIVHYTTHSMFIRILTTTCALAIVLYPVLNFTIKIFREQKEHEIIKMEHLT